MLEEDRSVASGRVDGGRSPPARAGRQSRSCWPRARQGQGRRGLAFEPRRGREARARARQRATGAGGRREGCQSEARHGRRRSRQCPTSSRRNSARSVERPPNGDGWVHEIKFDGYRVQIARRGRRGRAEDPQGAGLDRQVRRDRQGGGERCPTCIIDGEIVALDDKGMPDFSALQAALSDGKTDDLIFFAFDLLFARRRGSARAAAAASARSGCKRCSRQRKRAAS